MRSRSPGLGESDGHQWQFRRDPVEVPRVARHDPLPRPLRANDNMGVDDIRRPGSRQQEADSRCVGSVKRNEVRAGLSNESAEAGLPGRVSNGLC